MRNAKDLFAGAVAVGLLLAMGIAKDGLRGPCTAFGQTPTAKAATTDFFVSPAGNDRWSGRLADPGASDGPFATIARAREAVRALRKTLKDQRPVRVVFRSGTYYLDQPLEFGPEDSGAEKAPVVYAAAPGEKVVLSGGRRIVDQLVRRGTLAQLGILARTMRRLAFWEMTPHNDIVSPLEVRIDGQPWRSTFAIAKPGETYLVYLLNGGNGSIELAPGTYDVVQLDPRTGTETRLGSVQGGKTTFTVPSRSTQDHNLADESDWVLIYQRRADEKPPARPAPSHDKSWEAWLDRKLLPETEARGMMRGFLAEHLRPLPLPPTREAWLTRRDALRHEVLGVLGIADLVPPKWDLAVKSKGTLHRKTDLKSVLPSGYRIEKITFESYPGMAIPAVLYVPEGITGRVPGIVSISGHTPASKAADYVQQRNVNLALRGCVVLSYDYHGYGERKTGNDPNHPTGSNTHDIRSFSFSRRTATAIEVLDAIRAIDALLARPEVDPERIGFTGESGGSNSTYWIAAVDPRVKLAVPVSSVTTFDYWIRTDCNWDWHQRPPGIRRIADIGTLLALHAPRPLLIISSRRGTDDQEFPLEEAEKSYQWAKHVYRLLGAEDAAAQYESTTAHGYQEDKREQLYRAVERWLRPPFPKGEKELQVKVERVEELRCGLPEKNLTIRDVYAQWLKPLPRRSEPSDPAALRAFLRERLGWPQPLPAVKAEKVGQEQQGPWSAEFWLLETEPGIRLPAVLIARRPPPVTRDRVVTLVPGRDKQAVARALEAGRQVLAIDLRGTGEIAPPEGSVRNWAWFAGRPWPGQWALDLVQAARFCRDHRADGARLSASSVAVDAQNDYGWPALLAGAAGPEAIASGTVRVPRASLREELLARGDHALADMPGLLESLDIPQLRELWPGGQVSVRK